MKKHRVNRITIITLAATMVAFVVFPVVVHGNEDYLSPEFSAEIMENGEIKNLEIGNDIFMDHWQLVGDYSQYLVKKDHDGRFFQSRDHSKAVITTNAKSTVVEKEGGNLSNTKHAKGATYNQNITFTPTQIHAEYTVTTNVPLASKMNIFMVVCKLPLSLGGAGFEAITENGSGNMGTLPKEFSSSDPFKVAAQSLSIALPNGIVTIDCDANTLMSFEDARKWGMEGFQLNIFPKLPWHRSPVTFEAGSKFKWGFTISFTPEKK